MRTAYSDKVENQQLKVQELVIRYSDTELLAQSIASNSIVLIGEPISQIVDCLLVDPSGLMTIPSSALSIVNSDDYVPDLHGNIVPRFGHMHDAIKIAGVTLAPSAGSGVNLGSSSNFVILGASTVTNTGSSVLNGNLGLYPGTSVTGFPPGVVNGVEHITDAAAAQAQIDARAAYTALSTMSSTAIASTLDGQTLTPGVYSEASGTFNLAASGNGTLTLNGAGTYIFIASSTLVTGAGGIPTIALTGGATAANVFWAVGSSATINSGSAGTFVGTVIAQASVTDTMGGIVNGRLMALTAAVTLSAATTMSTPSSGVSAGDCFILKYITVN
jgi:hypothetical protein